MRTIHRVQVLIGVWIALLVSSRAIQMPLFVMSALKASTSPTVPRHFAKAITSVQPARQSPSLETAQSIPLAGCASQARSQLHRTHQAALLAVTVSSNMKLGRLIASTMPHVRPGQKSM
jgi:hypothetical protein